MGYEKTLWFSSSGSLEVLHSLLLKYCQHFSYAGMQARIELANLDHNYNTQRKQATTKDGIYIHVCCTYLLIIFSTYSIVFPKERKSWIAKLILQANNYNT